MFNEPEQHHVVDVRGLRLKRPVTEQEQRQEQQHKQQAGTE